MADKLFQINVNSDMSFEIEKEVGKVVKKKTVCSNEVLNLLKGIAKDEVISNIFLPQNTVYYKEYNTGINCIVIAVNKNRWDMTFENTQFKDVGYPNLLFGFRIANNKILKTKLITYKDLIIKPNTELFHYPYAHVMSEYDICWGSNKHEDITELWQLSSKPYQFISMPNGTDGYEGKNLSGLVYRELLNKMQGQDFKDEEYLIKANITFQEWVNRYL